MNVKSSSKYRDINQCAIEGNLCGDVEIKEINGKRLAKFRVACKNGERPDTFLSCDWWDPSRATDYLKKGKKVFVSGRIVQDEWTNRDTGKKEYKIYILVRDLDLRYSGEKRKEASYEGSDFEEELSSLMQ